jgi:protease I
VLGKLKDKKVAVLVTDGFEKVELTIPKKALEASGAKVDIISIHKGKIRSMNLHKPASTYKVDKLLSEVSPEDYSALFIPGGFINPDLLRQSELVRSFVKSFDELKKPIASLCHGPWVLASSEILEDRILTSWPGLRDDMVNAGATWVDEKVVLDGNLVTSRGPQDLPFFIPAMIRLFEAQSIKERNIQVAQSAPKAIEPPEIAVQAIRLMPNFHFKWTAIASVIGLGLYGAVTNKGFKFS